MQPDGSAVYSCFLVSMLSQPIEVKRKSSGRGNEE